MANTKSAQKQWRVNLKKRARNRAVRSAVRTQVTRARAAATTAPTAEDSAATVLQAIQILDKAAKKGVIHPNNAARRKSRLMKLYNGAQAAAS